MCTAGCNDTVQEWEEEREKRTGISVLEVRTVTFMWSLQAKKLPPHNWTLPGRISYTCLGRTCAGLCIVEYDFTQFTSRWFLVSSCPRPEVLSHITTTLKFPSLLGVMNLAFWHVFSSLCQTRHNHPPLQVVLQHSVGIANLSTFPSCS